MSNAITPSPAAPDEYLAALRNAIRGTESHLAKIRSAPRAERQATARKIIDTLRPAIKQARKLATQTELGRWREDFERAADRMDGLREEARTMLTGGSLPKK